MSRERGGVSERRGDACAHVHTFCWCAAPRAPFSAETSEARRSTSPRRESEVRRACSGLRSGLRALGSAPLPGARDVRGRTVHGRGTDGARRDRCRDATSARRAKSTRARARGRKTAAKKRTLKKQNQRGCIPVRGIAFATLWAQRAGAGRAAAHRMCPHALEHAGWRGGGGGPSHMCPHAEHAGWRWRRRRWQIRACS